MTMNSNAARLLITALGAAFMLTVIARGGQSKGQAQSPKAAQNSPEAVAESIWQKITTTCAATSRSAPQVFLEDDGQAQMIRTRRLYEFRDVWTMYLPEKLSEADRLNGVQSRGVSVLGYSASRQFDAGRNAWEEFEGGSAKKSAFVKYSQCDPMRSACGSLPYAKSVRMEKRNGQWAFSWGGDSFTDIKLDLDKMAATKKPCSVLTSANPFAAQ